MALRTAYYEQVVKALGAVGPSNRGTDTGSGSVEPAHRASSGLIPEVLNANLFESLAELRALTDAWLRIYNGERPHDSLGRVPPFTFLPRHSVAGQSPFELSA